MEKNIKLIISLLLPLFIGTIGSFFTDTTGWYADLNKPSINPPGWVFAPVWTVLYLMIGFSFFLVWTKGKEKSVAFSFFFVQLILNASWSFFFFTAENLLGAFVNIVLLWLAILGTIIFFYRSNKHAAYFLIPYLLWVTFAAYLNFKILIIN